MPRRICSRVARPSRCRPAAARVDAVGRERRLRAAADRGRVRRQERREAVGADEVGLRRDDGVVAGRTACAAGTSTKLIAEARVALAVRRRQRVPGGVGGHAGPVVLAEVELAGEVRVLLAGQIVERAIDGGGVARVVGVAGADERVELGEREGGLARIVEQLASSRRACRRRNRRGGRSRRRAFCM